MKRIVSIVIAAVLLLSLNVCAAADVALDPGRNLIGVPTVVLVPALAAVIAATALIIHMIRKGKK